jgi:preprotein translocase subunit SecA
MRQTLKKLLGGDLQAKTIKRIRKTIEQVNALEPKVQKLSDAEMRDKTREWQEGLKDGSVKLESILPEAFAVAREGAQRSIGQRHFDVQLIGGMVLHEGSVAEMRTGEGKTLVATAPVYLNALTGKGVHVVTVNDYLAQLHGGWMGQVYDFLGLTCGVIIPDASFIYDASYTEGTHDDARMNRLRPCTRKEAYAADITYGTNNEFGFDYLRDHMVSSAESLRQRPLNYAIVDEVDSILVDEARTPLIISAPAGESGSSYQLFSQIARTLVIDTDYIVDEKRKQVSLTDDGIEKVEKTLGIDNIYGPEHVRLVYHLDQAVKAEGLFKRDKDYVVTGDGEVIIVDEFTGRMMHGRRYNEGLHQAIEAKENVEVQQESMTLATISFQNYFRLYNKLSGMTGTAMTEAEEFYQIYKLDVVTIPTNRDMIRDDKTDKIFKNQHGKFTAIVAKAAELHEKGQPVLIGTVSIERNELLAGMLTKAGVPHQILNAKNNEKEAGIVAKAGQVGSVTLATNIAGRGTDIMLSEEAKKLGGLFVIGSERHESRRIDNQLRGRAGRQGDAGTSQFYVSCEDDLMRIFAGERIAKLMDRLGVDEDTPIENKSVSKSIEGAQKKVEGRNFDSRKNVVQYDDVMNRHRKATYIKRDETLKKDDVSSMIKGIILKEADSLSALTDLSPTAYAELVSGVFPLSETQRSELEKSDKNKRARLLTKLAQDFYTEKEEEFSPEIFRVVERDLFLQVLDNLWINHLENMDHLREGIGWRGVGQKDPLVEYRREGQLLYDTMQKQLQTNLTRMLLTAMPTQKSLTDGVMDTELTRAAAGAVESGDMDHTHEHAHESDFDGVVTAKSETKSIAKAKNKKKVTRKKERKNKQKAKKR